MLAYLPLRWAPTMLCFPWNFTLSSLFLSFLHCGQQSDERDGQLEKERWRLLSPVPRGAKPTDTVQQLVNEQTVLAPYARGHSSHWPSHKEMVFADLGYKSGREFMVHHVSDFLPECSEQYSTLESLWTLRKHASISEGEAALAKPIWKQLPWVSAAAPWAPATLSASLSHSTLSFWNIHTWEESRLTIEPEGNSVPRQTGRHVMKSSSHKSCSRWRCLVLGF